MFQSKSSLEVAVEAAARVDAVLAKRGKIKPNPIASALATANKSQTDLFQTEFEINDVPLTARNLLTKGITQEEINHFSGASISTRGRYFNSEDKAKPPKGERPLYLFIQGPNKQSLDLAIQRIDSLIKEVMEQEKFKMGPPPPILTMQTSLPGMEKVIVGLDNAPPNYDVRNKVLGPAGANLQYISNETGAVVTLRGRTSGYPEAGTGQESPEPLHICVEHQKIEVLQAARQLAFNLVETIQQEFTQIHPQPPPLQLPPQPGQVQTVTLQPDQLPPGMVPTSIQLPVLSQQPGQVGQLVNIPPPSLAVPPPQLVQQPPPLQTVNLPPPGVHIPSHQGPLVPQQQQGGVQQQIIQQPPPSAPPTGLPPPSQPTHITHQLISQSGPILSQPPPSVTSQSGQVIAPPTSVVTSVPQQTQAFITHATYPVQYIQANGQTLMAYPQLKPDGQNQVQLIQTQQGQVLQAQPGTVIPGQQQAQLQLIPGPGGTQQLVMQQPQQVTMLLQYQQQNEPGKGARLISPQRLATPLQIQLQPGVQLINPQLLQTGQTQLQLQLQQPIAQQLMQQTVRTITPQQIQQTRPPSIQQTEQQQVQQQIQQIQQQQLQQQQLQQQQQQQQLQQQQLQQQQQQQLQQQHVSQQIQQQIHQMPPQQVIQQQIPPQTQQITQSQQPQANQPMQQQSQQQGQQNPQVQQSPQQMQPHQNTQQQPQQQQQTQVSPQQMQQQQQTAPQKEMTPQQNQQNQQIQKQNQGQQNQQPTLSNRAPPPQPQQQGQKRRYEGDDQSSKTYPGPPQPVPPPKVPPPQKHQVPTRGVGNGPNMAQKAAVTQMSQLPPQIQKQLMPPPPPPQSGAPDDWRNNPEQMNQANRVGDQPQGDNRANPPRQERPTFNHYSSKPQLYNANMPFHMQGLGAYPPPPPPPPPGPNSTMVPGQYPFYQQQPPTSQYPYFMMHHQQ